MAIPRVTKQIFNTKFFENSPEIKRQFIKSLYLLSANVDFQVIIDMLNDALNKCDKENRMQSDDVRLRQSQGASQLIEEFLSLNKRAGEIINLNK